MGIVQGCASRDKDSDSEKKLIKFDLQGFQESAFDDESTKIINERKTFRHDLQTNKGTAFMKNYDFLLQEKKMLKPENYEWISDNFKLWQYSPETRKKVVEVLEMLAHDNLEIIENLKGFYNFASVRKFLLRNNENIEDTYIQILKDIKYKNKKLLEYKKNIRLILNTKKFFLCGLDSYMAPCLAIRPNRLSAKQKQAQKAANAAAEEKKSSADDADSNAQDEEDEKIKVETKPGLELDSLEHEITPEGYENLFIYLIEDALPSLLKEKPHFLNKLTILLDFENKHADADILKQIIKVSEEHYFGVVHKIFIINLKLEILTSDFVEVIKTCPRKTLITIFDKTYKQNIIKSVKPESFLSLYGGMKTYKPSYNLSNDQICFDFDEGFKPSLFSRE